MLARTGFLITTDKDSTSSTKESGRTETETTADVSPAGILIDPEPAT
jgi:hypothetical protein